MSSDSAYLSQYPRMLSLLLESCDGKPESIPQNYLDNFHHKFADGDISLVPAFSALTGLEFAEFWHIEEAAELLSKVNPDHWPDCSDIASIDLGQLFDEKCEESTEFSLHFVEDNLGTAEKTERVLKQVIESVFGKGVSSIRDRAGNFPSVKNKFLQEDDGTFSGTFKFEDHLFLFEIAPNEGGWICTYRLSEKSLDRLEKPRFKSDREEKQKHKRRSVRTRAWY